MRTCIEQENDGTYHYSQVHADGVAMRRLREVGAEQVIIDYANDIGVSAFTAGIAWTEGRGATLAEAADACFAALKEQDDR